MWSINFFLNDYVSVVHISIHPSKTPIIGSQLSQNSTKIQILGNKQDDAMYLLIEISLDWCYNKIASRFKVTWNICHIISSKLALVNGNLPQLSLRDGGWQQQQKCGFKKWFCVVSIFIANNLLWSNVGELSWSWIPKNNIQVQKEKENFVMAFLHPP